MIERLALRPADLDRRLREYSAGMKRKLGIVQAFQAAPSLLVLDEPTEGLDPLMQDAFFTLLREVRERGRTVFLSSHVLSEVERVCDRVALLRQGALVLVSTVDDLRALAARTVRVVFGRAVERPEGPWPDGCEPVALGPSEWKLTVSGALGPLLGRLSGLPVADLEAQEPASRGRASALLPGRGCYAWRRRADSALSEAVGGPGSPWDRFLRRSRWSLPSPAPRFTARGSSVRSPRSFRPWSAC